MRSWLVLSLLLVAGCDDSSVVAEPDFASVDLAGVDTAALDLAATAGDMACDVTSCPPPSSECVMAVCNANGSCGETPVPDAGTQTAAGCTLNESNSPHEADYCALQFPTSLTVQAGTTTPAIYGRLYEAGLTPPAGASSWVAQVGYGPDGANPESQSGWTWFPTTYNTQSGNDDEYQGTFTAPAAGTYRYTYRFSPDGQSWTYCDLDGAGSNANLTFEVTQLPVLSVTP